MNTVYIRYYRGDLHRDVIQKRVDGVWRDVPPDEPIPAWVWKAWGGLLR